MNKEKSVQVQTAADNIIAKAKELPKSIDQVKEDTYWDDQYLLDVDFSENTPFYPSPKSHYRYRKENYTKGTVGLLPLGDFYGL